MNYGEAKSEAINAAIKATAHATDAGKTGELRSHESARNWSLVSQAWADIAALYIMEAGAREEVEPADDGPLNHPELTVERLIRTGAHGFVYEENHLKRREEAAMDSAYQTGDHFEEDIPPRPWEEKK